MTQYDTKLFYGTELGPLPDIIQKFNNILPTPPRVPNDAIDTIGWMNTQLPEGVFLDATYPYRDCDPKKMVAHLNLLSGDEGNSITYKKMKKILKKSNYTDYANILGKLGMDYQEPTFYTQIYVY